MPTDPSPPVESHIDNLSQLLQALAGNPQKVVDYISRLRANGRVAEQNAADLQKALEDSLWAQNEACESTKGALEELDELYAAETRARSTIEYSLELLEGKRLRHHGYGPIDPQNCADQSCTNHNTHLTVDCPSRCTAGIRTQPEHSATEVFPHLSPAPIGTGSEQMDVCSCACHTTCTKPHQMSMEDPFHLCQDVAFANPDYSAMEDTSHLPPAASCIDPCSSTDNPPALTSLENAQEIFGFGSAVGGGKTTAMEQQVSVGNVSQGEWLKAIEGIERSVQHLKDEKENYKQRANQVEDDNDELEAQVWGLKRKLDQVAAAFAGAPIDMTALPAKRSRTPQSVRRDSIPASPRAAANGSPDSQRSASIWSPIDSRRVQFPATEGRLHESSQQGFISCPARGLHTDLSTAQAQSSDSQSCLEDHTHAESV